MRIFMGERIRKLAITLAAARWATCCPSFPACSPPCNPQVTFDFSHLATFAIAITFGPWYGWLAAALGFDLSLFRLCGLRDLRPMVRPGHHIRQIHDRAFLRTAERHAADLPGH